MEEPCAACPGTGTSEGAPTESSSADPWTGYEYSEHPFVSRPWPEAARALLGEDADCPENGAFRYGMVRPASDAGARSRKLIVLLHGLNERSWSKYLPWARSLVERTGAAVLLFPLAFHMQRSPSLCRDRDRVFGLYRERKNALGPEAETSHANAVLSQRLQERPLRFFTSGLQSYRDAADIAAMCEGGEASPGGA
jgi:hypothetical protein